MKKLLVSILTSVALLVPMADAGARPMYWYNTGHTYTHGWVVRAGNDSYDTTIRTSCHWYAGQRWHLNWVLGPGDWYWTTSDAGGYGNQRPQGLMCSYVEV